MSAALSATQSACVCELGYMSTGRITSTSPCTLCRAGILCNGVPVKEVIISAAPLENVTTQVLVAKKPMPAANSMVSLFLGVPTNVESIRATLPNRNATIYLRQVCRGSYCVACEDNTATCIRLVTVGLQSQLGGGYFANATTLKRDVLYVFAASTASDCTPRISGVPDEFTSNNLVVISSTAAISTVRVVCVSDESVFVDIPVGSA